MVGIGNAKNVEASTTAQLGTEAKCMFTQYTSVDNRE